MDLCDLPAPLSNNLHLTAYAPGTYCCTYATGETATHHTCKGSPSRRQIARITGPSQHGISIYRHLEQVRGFGALCVQYVLRIADQLTRSCSMFTSIPFWLRGIRWVS